MRRLRTIDTEIDHPINGQMDWLPRRFVRAHFDEVQLDVPEYARNTTSLLRRGRAGSAGRGPAPKRGWARCDSKWTLALFGSIGHEPVDQLRVELRLGHATGYPACR